MREDPSSKVQATLGHQTSFEWTNRGFLGICEGHATPTRTNECFSTNERVRQSSQLYTLEWRYGVALPAEGSN